MKITRHPLNPILTKNDVPYSASLIFNAGVCKYQGRYVMAFRNDYGYGEKAPGRFTGTNIGLAFSDDGIHWTPEKKPWIEWKDQEVSRAYDPRLTIVDGKIVICFAVDTAHGVRGGIATTEDFDTWEIQSLSVPDNRNMVVFPEKINGKFCRLERPFRLQPGPRPLRSLVLRFAGPEVLGQHSACSGGGGRSLRERQDRPRSASGANIERLADHFSCR